MVEWFEDIVHMFLKFTGTGWLHWLAAVLVLAVYMTRRQDTRHKLVYPTLIIYIIFFNPLIYGTIGIRFMSGMYWRMLWLIPVPMIIALAGAQLCTAAKNRAVKALVMAIIVILLAVSGKPMYTAQNFIPAQNVYQIPQVTIDVADAIMTDMGESDRTMVVVPDELLCSLRQYTTRLNLLYGRNAYGYITEMGDIQAIIHDEMVKVNPDTEKIAIYSKEKGVQYIVFNSIYHMEYDLIENYGYSHCSSIDGYDIYKKSL